MPERKMTYAVEIDASQAQAAARVLRAIFEKELRSVTAGMVGGQGGGGPAAAMAEAVRPATAMKKALEDIGRVDLTKPADALLAQLGEIDAALRRTRNEYERLGTLASARTSGGGRAQAGYVQDVRNQVGDQAAAAMAHTGRALNIGQRGAEFKNDEEAFYLQAEKDFVQAGEKRTEKMRYTTEEKVRLAQLEMEMYDAELQGVRVQQELARRRMAEVESSASGMELNAATAPIFEEADRLQAETLDLAQQEETLLASIRQTNDRMGEMIEGEAARIRTTQARQSGQIGAGGTSSQTAITVSANSVRNAEQLAAALKESAEATERMQRSRTNTDIRGFELETEREKLRMQQQVAQQVAATVEVEKTAGAAQRAEIAKTTAAATAGEQARVAVARGEAAVRVQAARGEAVAVGEAAKAARSMAIEEERRRTAQFKAELRARQQAQDAQQQRQSINNGLRSVAFGVAGALGIYSADQVIRTGLEWGREGATQMRMAETFENLAQRAGQSANKLKTTISEASGQTITDMDAMGLAAQVLARKWSSNITSLDSDLGILVAASRKYSRMFTDEQGNFLSTQEIFARFVKFSAEGNKELVDQFGLSNAAIADSLGITVDGLAGATGATDRWRGMVKLLGEDLERLGGTNDTVADRIERSATRIEAAKQRIQSALAEPTADLYGIGANVVEGLTISLPAEQMRNRLSELQESQGANWFTGRTQEQADETTRRMEIMKMAVSQVETAQTSGYAGASQYASALREVYAAVSLNNDVTDEQLQLLYDINNWFVQVDGAALGAAAGINEVGDASADTTDRMAAMGEATAGMSGDLRALAMVAVSAGIDIDNLGDAVSGLQSRMGLALQQYDEFNAESQRVGQALLGAAVGSVQLQGPQAANQMLQTQLAGFEEIQAGLRRTGVTSGPQMQLTMEEARLQLMAPFEALEEAERARVQAEREWERAATNTGSAMSEAADSMVEEFKSALQGVPGLFGTSGVTDEQMQQAAAGVPQSFADDYLRRLRDEVVNKTDWADVDIGDAAQRAGINGGLPPGIILSMFEQAWGDQSLFAGGKNLDLINQEAVKANLARQDASKSGQASLFALFGVGGDMPTPLGLPEAQAMQAGGAAGAAPDGSAMLAQMADAMEAGLDSSVKDRLYNVGQGIVDNIHRGFSDGVTALEWGGQIIDSLAAAVAGPVFDMLNAQLAQQP